MAPAYPANDHESLFFFFIVGYLHRFLAFLYLFYIARASSPT